MSAATVAEPRQALQALADQLRSEDTPIAPHVVDPAAASPVAALWPSMVVPVGRLSIRRAGCKPTNAVAFGM